MELNPVLSNIIAIIAMVTGLALSAWWIISLYYVHSRSEEKELPEVDLPANLHEVMGVVPASLVIFYAFIGLSCVLYVLYVWLGGITY